MDSDGKRGFGLQVVLFGFLGLAAAGVLFWFDPTQYHFYPVCVFHGVTGLQCPGCGSLRALHALLHGNVASAFHFNALLIISFPFAAWYAVWYGWRRLKHQPARLRLRPLWIWAFLIVTLAFGILRNLPGEPFALLRP